MDIGSIMQYALEIIKKKSHIQVFYIINMPVGEDLTYLVIVKDAYLQTDDGHKSIS